jgi:hypothetical protein
MLRFAPPKKSSSLDKEHTIMLNTIGGNSAGDSHCVKMGDLRTVNPTGAKFK